MDKRLIDADKQLEWMDKNYYRYETKNDFFEGISEAIKRGLFDHDPIPLPTIKPGNKVRHVHFGEGRVELITTIKADVYFPDSFERVLLDISDLEVISHD